MAYVARILVADDDADQLVLAQKLLGAIGHQVTPAATPAAALSEIAKQAPDLLVIDLGLPLPSDGLSLIREIRKSGCAAPIILLSGWPEEIFGRPEEAMVSRVLMKGNVRELLSTIANLQL